MFDSHKCKNQSDTVDSARVANQTQSRDISADDTDGRTWMCLLNNGLLS
jgi:hypothetical protein